MDWTTSLKSQQVDFIARLNHDPTTLLHCPIPGVHSEVVAIADERLKKIWAFCRKTLVESTLPSVAPSMSVRQMLGEQLPLELAIEAIAIILAEKVTKVDPKERQSIKRSLNFCLKDTTGKTQAIFGIQVKVAQDIPQQAQWQINLEEINQNVVVICVLLPKDVKTSDTEHRPILVGFLPTEPIKTAQESATLKLPDLLYMGGLVSYLESLKTEFTSEFTSQPSTADPENSGEWLRPLTSGSSYVYPLAVSADGETIASSSYDGSIKLWRIGDRQLLNALGGQPWSSYPSTGNAAAKIANSNSESNTDESQVGIGKLIRSLPGHSSGVSALAISPDGEILASGDYNGMIALWNLATGELLRKFSGHSGTIKPMIVSPDNRLLATGSTDKILKVWNIETGIMIRSFSLSDPPVAIAISPDGQMIASGSSEGIINIMDLSSGELKHQLTGHAGLVDSLLISADGQTLGSSSTEKTIKLWNLQSGELLNILTGYANPMMALTVKPDGQTLEFTITHRQQPGWH